MKIYDESTGIILSQKDYIELVKSFKREVRQIYIEYLESLEEDEEVESFESSSNRMFEMESDFVALNDNNEIITEL